MANVGKNTPNNSNSITNKASAVPRVASDRRNSASPIAITNANTRNSSQLPLNVVNRRLPVFAGLRPQSAEFIKLAIDGKRIARIVGDGNSFAHPTHQPRYPHRAANELAERSSDRKPACSSVHGP